MPPSVALGDRKAALAVLEQAYAARDPSISIIGTDPIFDPLRSDPRFVALTRAMRVPNDSRPASASARVAVD